METMSESPTKRLKSEQGSVNTSTDACPTAGDQGPSKPEGNEVIISTGNPTAEASSSPPFHFTDDLTLESLRQQWTRFNHDRDWDKFHAPRNVLLDLVSEVGELAEIFQWKGEVSPGLPEMTSSERRHVGEELSDVLLATVNLAHKCQIDLTQAVRDKMVLTGDKYPVDKCYGKANKYTDYQ